MVVFNACDGMTTFDQLRRQYKFSEDLVYLTLDLLREKNLIEDYQSKFAGISRREAVKKVGLACAVALPVIAAITAPVAAQAASVQFAAGSRNLSESCNTSTDCNQANAPACVTVRGQSNTGKACCQNGTSQPVFLIGGDPNGGGTVTYGSQASCVNAVSPQCCSRMATCNCTPNGNGTVSCRSVCQ